MSKLKELIAELCPNGVEYKKLGEIATDIYRGAGIKRDEITEHGIPCVRYGEIYTSYGIWFDKCISHTDENKIASKKYFEYGDILFAITGESVEDIAKSIAYVGHEKCLAGGDIVVLKHKQNPKYLAYALSTAEAKLQKSKGKVKSKVVHSSVPAIKEIKIPVPPLEIQREIVRILDSFTSLTAELQTKLQAELQARQKQYEYYRDQLLTFDVHGGGTSEVQWKTLGEVSDIISGFPFDSSQFTESGIRLMRGMNVKRGRLDFSESNNRYWSSYDGLEKYLLDANDIVIAMDGSLVGKSFGVVTKSQLPLLLVQRVARIRVTGANSRYVYHCVTNSFSSYVDSKKTEGAVPHISLKDISNFKIPTPPIMIQERIAEVLDNFDAICSDLNIGLPAEIEARQKQYEYYRDRLLSFPELTR